MKVLLDKLISLTNSLVQSNRISSTIASEIPSLELVNVSFLNKQQTKFEVSLISQNSRINLKQNGSNSFLIKYCLSMAGKLYSYS